MTTNDLIQLYIDSYESGSNDLRSINGWLKDKNIKLIAKNGKIIKVTAL